MDLMRIKNWHAAVFCIVLFALSAFLLLGCKPKEVVTSERTLSDSVRTERWVEYRDTSIIVEADSAAIMALVPGCPDLPQQTTQNGRVKLTVSVKDGQLKADCKCKELEKKLRLMFTHQVSERFRNERQHDTKIVREKFVPGFVKFLAWSGGIAYLIIIGILLWKLGVFIFKTYIKTFKPI